MPNIDQVYREVFASHLVPPGSSGIHRSRDFTFTEDFNKISQAIGQAVYTAAYGMGAPGSVRKIETSVKNSVTRRFYPYVNAAARTNPKAFWHLYDGNHVGESPYALFAFDSKQTGSSTFDMAITFRPSTIMIPLTPAQATPGPSGRTVKKSARFWNKALVMEYGLPTRIAPVKGKFLVFEGKSGNLVFHKGTIVVDHSNSQTRGALRAIANRFFIGGPGETTINQIGERYAEEISRVSGMAARYDLNVSIASDARAKSIAASLGKAIATVEV